MNKLVWNERVKLAAGLFQNAATAAVGIGLLAPLAAFLYNPTTLTPSVSLWLAILPWIASVAVFHGVAQMILGKLRE